MKLIVPILVSGIITACANDIDLPENPSDEVITASVELQYTGSIAVDGCEFFVKYNDKVYKPLNEEVISDDFRSGNRVVEMQFELQEQTIDYQCGLNPKPTTYPALRIISMGN